MTASFLALVCCHSYRSDRRSPGVAGPESRASLAACGRSTHLSSWVVTTKPLPADDSDNNEAQPAGDPVTVSRRAAIAIGGIAFTRLAIGQTPASASATPSDAAAVVDALQPEINPRQAWGDDLPVVGDIVAEDDVRFLLVHHTASTNDYGPDEVIDQIRGFYDFHTSPEKGWPDVAYNFFVDRFGGIWEARAGSTAGPVRGDATGGSQGFGLLCSLIGDHSKVEISSEAQTAMVGLLAWLAERHQVDTSPGAQTEFVSRGSNRWPQGTPVTTNTISGHRDMSQTACPGDFAYNLLATDFPTRVSELRLAAAASIAERAALEVDLNDVSTTTAPPVSAKQTTDPPAPAVEAESEGDAIATPSSTNDTSLPSATTVGIGATIVAALAAGAAKFRRRAIEPDLWEDYEN